MAGNLPPFMAKKAGTSFQNNKPVGNAGQPQNGAKAGAISRRLAKMSQDKTKGKK